MLEVWEPWSPKPGDRVKIRLSAECRRVFPQIDGDALGPPEVIQAMQKKWHGHPRELDGAVGQVMMYRGEDFVPKDIADDGHYYPVEFDNYISVDLGDFGKKLFCNVDTFAALELEPL